MHKQKFFYFASSLGLSITALVSLPMYALPMYAQVTPKTVKPKPATVKPATVKPGAVKSTPAKPATNVNSTVKPTVQQPNMVKPSAPAEATAAKPTLDVTFQQLKTSAGQVCLSLFSGPKGFPSGGAGSDLLVSKCTPVVNSSATFSFSDLKPGKYAITAFHDANTDGKMNKTAFGLPEEGFGFSNNPEIAFSAPTFAETEFQVSETKSTVSIKFKYF